MLRAVLIAGLLALPLAAAHPFNDSQERIHYACVYLAGDRTGCETSNFHPTTGGTGNYTVTLTPETPLLGPVQTWRWTLRLWMAPA